MSLKRILCLLICLLTVLPAAYADELPAGVTPLPIDFTGGYPLQADGFLGDWEYQDPSIHVVISSGNYQDTLYWAADIQVADASQIRTASADGFDSNMTIRGETLAKRVNAIVAVDGDYFCYDPLGYTVRQGRLYENYMRHTRDVLVIDDKGDMYCVREADEADFGDDLTWNGHRIVNSFFFGPLLMEERLYRLYGYEYGIGPNNHSQRVCIGQIEPLHYMIIVTGPTARGSYGMTLEQFRTFVRTNFKELQFAYNLDGGDSSMLIFNGVKVNDPENPDTRDIADIIYFASAYQGAE